MTKLAFKNLQGEVSVDLLNEFICDHEVIGVKIRTESEWINDTVEKVKKDSNIFEIRLLEEFISQDLMVEDTIYCRYIKEDTEYVIEAKVADVGIIHPQKVMLEALKVAKYDNARNSKRYTVNLCGRVTYNDGENGAFITIKNISRTGISITCRECLGINDEVDVEIVLWQKEVLAIEGRIVRLLKVGNNYRYGIIIENMEPKSRELMEEFIEELEKREKEI